MQDWGLKNVTLRLINALYKHLQRLKNINDTAYLQHIYSTRAYMPT